MINSSGRVFDSLTLIISQTRMDTVNREAFMLFSAGKSNPQYCTQLSYSDCFTGQDFLNI